MSAPLSPEQRAMILAQLADAQPATNGLLESFGRSIADMRQHSHPTWEDLFCMNLSSYMGERSAPVLRRLLDAEAEAERLRADYGNAVATVARLETERHETNEALSDAAEALRAANTAAGLVAEYHIPTVDGGWLGVRREPNGDRWSVYTAGRVLGDRKTWTGEMWISIALAADSELWNYSSADAALAEATRLAETAVTS